MRLDASPRTMRLDSRRGRCGSTRRRGPASDADGALLESTLFETQTSFARAAAATASTQSAARGIIARREPSPPRAPHGAPAAAGGSRPSSEPSAAGSADHGGPSAAISAERKMSASRGPERSALPRRRRLSDRFPFSGCLAPTIRADASFSPRRRRDRVRSFERRDRSLQRRGQFMRAPRPCRVRRRAQSSQQASELWRGQRALVLGALWESERSFKRSCSCQGAFVRVNSTAGAPRPLQACHPSSSGTYQGNRTDRFLEVGRRSLPSCFFLG